MMIFFSDSLFGDVTGVTGVQINNGGAFRCYVSKKRDVTDVTLDE
jgi:hypothetical protein